ncbi:hypothetical protein A3Q56_00248 [Intoshia linei]|uniref:Choline/carnitine acyltransferase domain-containing protein n=1 Tax=Intoshia linei TaxID=1819745 RepID=A0A177BCQ6_9BILA|nr:hypothetical protein A3Q56_00248 [Intoshia linei]
MLNILRKKSFKSLQCCFYSTEFIHKAVIPTYHFQKSLPLLPLPKLEDTCKRYLKSLKPLLSNEIYEKTNKIAMNFLSSKDASVLNGICQDFVKENVDTSYIAGPWSEMYLCSRAPIVLNFNPFMGIKTEKKAGLTHMLVNASNMIYASALFQNSLFHYKLEPDVFHMTNKSNFMKNFYNWTTRMTPRKFSWYSSYLQNGYPLDMCQYENLFASTRIPQKNRDKLLSSWRTDKPKHICVLRNGKIYKLDIFDKNYQIVLPSVIFNSLSQIVGAIDNCEKSHEIAVLTGDERNTWAENRQYLSQLGTNSQSLKQIDSALYCVSLNSTTVKDFELLTKLFLHNEPGNLWFDKSFTLMFEPGGENCVHFEHSWGDGIAVVNFYKTISDFCASQNDKLLQHNCINASFDKNVVSNFSEINFKLDENMTDRINKSRQSFLDRTNLLDSCHAELNLNKNLIKKSSLSPDAVMQMIFQLAMFLQNGICVPTYESCSTAAFKKGRTETIRSCTNETKKFCKSAIKKDVSDAELRTLMKNCSIKHMQLAKNATLGQGYDRHMFAMNYYAQKRGLKLDIFEDDSYIYNSKHIMSTSTVSFGNQMTLGSFAPTTPNGYGIGYSITDKECGVNITAYKNERSAKDFISCIEKAVEMTLRLIK